MRLKRQLLVNVNQIFKGKMDFIKIKYFNHWTQMITVQQGPIRTAQKPQSDQTSTRLRQLQVVLHKRMARSANCSILKNYFDLWYNNEVF